MMEIREDTSEEEDNGQGGIASESSGSDEGSGNENADDEVDDVDSPSSSGAWTPGQNLGPLPSVGSADHSRGTCKRCNFFPKGRCQNGADCTFCHYPHDKRKPSRQEKRDRRAARLTHREGAEGGALAMADDQMRSLFSGDLDAASVGGPLQGHGAHRAGRRLLRGGGGEDRADLESGG